MEVCPCFVPMAIPALLRTYSGGSSLVLAHVRDVRCAESTDPSRPIRLLFNDGPGGWHIDLTVVQAWEVSGDLAAQLARHPAPDLPGRRP